MLQLEPFAKYAEEYEAWFEKYPLVFESEIMAIKQQLLKLPQNISGIQIGVGTGRFAEALGIKEGIEPVDEMAKFALKRGIEIMRGAAERLPYRDLHFDFVLFITICHLNNVPAAFREAYRVLKKGRSIIVGFLDKEQSIALSYEEKREKSHFYRHATFYTVDRVKILLEEAGFKNLEFLQTLFGELDDIHTLQDPLPGYGKGSFVVVRATK